MNGEPNDALNTPEKIVESRSRTIKEFHRQLTLLENIREAQLKCAHTLVIVNKTIIACSECGAFWITE